MLRRPLDPPERLLRRPLVRPRCPVRCRTPGASLENAAISAHLNAHPLTQIKPGGPAMATAQGIPQARMKAGQLASRNADLSAAGAQRYDVRYIQGSRKSAASAPLDGMKLWETVTSWPKMLRIKGANVGVRGSGSPSGGPSGQGFQGHGFFSLSALNVETC